LYFKGDITGNAFKIAKKSARRLLPKQLYGAGRNYYRRVKKWQYNRLPLLTEADMWQILVQDLGLRPGMIVFVHCSLDYMRLDFPFYRILGLLRQAIGETGTLIFPSTHLSERPEDWLVRDQVFDCCKTPTTMGLIAEFARRQPGALRSAHPTHSVAALGPQALALVQEHGASIYPCGPLSPYGKLAEYEARIVGLGVGTETMTFVHCVEDINPEGFPVQTRPEQVYRGRVRDLAGEEKVVETLVAHPRIRWRRIRPYMKRHVAAEICRDFQVSGGHFFVAKARPLLACMTELAEVGTTIYAPWVYKKLW
jgi:aminoglycoside N3'-acetyltransferase